MRASDAGASGFEGLFSTLVLDMSKAPWRFQKFKPNFSLEIPSVIEYDKITTE